MLDVDDDSSDDDDDADDNDDVTYIWPKFALAANKLKPGYHNPWDSVGIVVISIFGCPYYLSWPGFHLSV